jgi:hypothetical protein
VGRCCRGIWSVVRLGNAKAKVRVVGGQPADFWDLWC